MIDRCSTFLLTTVACVLVAPTCALAQNFSKYKVYYTYKSCPVTTDYIYNAKMDPVCGVSDPTWTEDPSCGPESYNLCASPEFGEDYLEDLSGKDRIYYEWEKPQIQLTDDFCFDRAENFEEMVNSSGNPRPGNVPPPAPGTRYKVQTFQWKVHVRGDLTIHQCAISYRVFRIHYKEGRSASCGVAAYKKCVNSTPYKTCRNSAFGQEAFKVEKIRDIWCGVENVSLADDENRIIFGRQTPDGKYAGQNDGDQHVNYLCDDTQLHQTRNVMTQGGESSAAERLRCLVQNKKLMLQYLSETNQSADGSSPAISAIQAKETDIVAAALTQSWPSLYLSALETNSGEEREIQAAINGIPAASYFKLVDSLFSEAFQPKKTFDLMTPLFDILTPRDLIETVAPFSTLANAKLRLAAGNYAGETYARAQSILVAEFYIRMVAAYVYQRSKELLLLQSLGERIQEASTQQEQDLSELRQKINTMTLPPDIRTLVLTQLSAARTKSEYANVVNQLSAQARADINDTISDNEEFVKEEKDKDPLLGIMAPHLQLIKNNVNQALLAYREVALAYRQVDDKTRKAMRLDDYSPMFKENFKNHLQFMLQNSQRLYSVLSQSGPVSLEGVLRSNNDISMTFALMDLLGKLSVSDSTSLNNVRLTLLQHIKTRIIDPLTAAISDPGIQ